MIKLQKNIYWFYLILIVFFSLLYITTLYYEFYPVSFLKIFGAFIPLLIIFHAKKRVKWFHSFLLFVYAFILFNLSRIFLDLLDVFDLSETSMYIFYRISDKTLCESLILIITSLVSVSFSFFFFDMRKTHDWSKNVIIISDINYKHLLIILLIILLPGTILKTWHDFNFVRQHGYLEIYNNFV